jgi:hypothetical protein
MRSSIGTTSLHYIHPPPHFLLGPRFLQSSFQIDTVKTCVRSEPDMKGALLHRPAIIIHSETEASHYVASGPWDFLNV